MKTIIIALLFFTMPSFAQQKAYNDELADMDSFTIKGRNEATAGQPQDIAAGDIAEDTTPASGEYLIGFDATDQLIKVNIANLSGGGGGGVSAVGTPVDGQVGVWTGSAAIEGTSALVFDGKLGVGTDSPQEEIHIYNPATPDAGSAILFNNATTGATATDGLFAGYSNKGYLWNYESTDIDFATSNTARLRLTSAGDLNLISGDITLASSSTVDGRDISIDGTKLDSVVTGAHTTTLAASAITVDNSSFDVLAGSDAQTLWNENDQALLLARSTGISSGGDLTNLGSGVVRIDAGSGSILNNVDPFNQIYSSIDWIQTDFDFSALDGLYFICVNSSGIVTFTTTTPPSIADYTTDIWLWRVSVRAGVVAGTLPIPQPIQQVAPQIRGVYEALGDKKDGISISAASTDLSFSYGGGSVYRPGVNFFNNAISSHKIEISAQSPVTFQHVDQNNVRSADTTQLDVGNWDNAGTTEAISGAGSRSQIFTIFISPFSLNVRAIRGQEFYSNIGDAFTALQSGTYSPIVPQQILDATVLIGWVIAEKSATDLSDGTQIFVTSNRDGTIGGSVSTSGASALLVANNLSDISDLSVAKTNLNYLASEITTLTTNFDNNLSASDTNLQLALDTLNDLSVSADSLTWSLGTQSEVASGGNAFEFDTENSFTSGNIISIKDNGVEHFSIDHDGSIGIDKTQAGFASIGSVNGGLIVSGIESVILGDSTGTRNSSTLNKSEMIFGSVDDSFIYPQEHNSGTGKSRLTIRGARPSTADTNGDGAAISIGGGEGRGTGGNGPIIFEQMRITPVLDADLSAGETAMYLDESANKIIFKSKYSDGSTVKIFEIEANP